MATDGINIPITFGSPADVADAIEDLGDKLKDTGDDAAKYAREQEAAARGTIELTGKAAAAAGAVAAFGRTVRSEAITAIGELAQQSASSAQQFAALGLALGPQGALVGGIIGALLPAIGRLIGETDDQAEAHRDAADAAREERERLDELTESIIGNYRAREERGRLRQGNFANADEAEQVRTEAAQEARALEQEISRLETQIARLERQGISADSLRERQTQLRTRQFAATMLSAGAEEALQGFTQAEIQEAGNADRDRRRQAASGNETQAEGAERFRQQAIELADWGEDLAQQTVDRRKAIEDEYREYTHQRQIEMIEAEQRAKHNAEEAEEQRAQRAARAAQASREAMQESLALERSLARATEERLDKSREDTKDFANMVGAANGMFIDAITETIKGTKSAEDAFRGLLAGFLEYIAQQAALKAAFEYAEAIAGFARQDYSAGAQHLVAGVAYTGVAILAGVGAAAVAPPAAQSKTPSEPSRSQQGGESTPGNIVINWNSPVVTSGTRDELGRQLRNLVRAGDSRYGG